MTQLFQSNCRRGHLLMVNLMDINLEAKLWAWLKEEHNDIYWDIEMQQGGTISVAHNLITFSGDNGIYELEKCIAYTI